MDEAEEGGEEEEEEEDAAVADGPFITLKASIH